MRLLREDMGVTQDDFAKLLGISLSAVAKWESGTNAPGKQAVKRIAEVTGVSADWLVDGVGTMWPGDRRPASRPTTQEVPATIDGVPVIDAVVGGEAVQRMPLVVGGQVLAYVTVTIKIEPIAGAIDLRNLE